MLKLKLSFFIDFFHNLFTFIISLRRELRDNILYKIFNFSYWINFTTQGGFPEKSWSMLHIVGGSINPIAILPARDDVQHAPAFLREAALGSEIDPV
jgi:hypothetical protein